MNVLQVHNFYQQAGGEDSVFANEHNLLTAHGHQVTQFTLDNDLIESMARPVLIGRTFWNRASYRAARSLIRSSKAQIVHCHNTFPLVSPSIYWAAEHEHVPVVQTIHNYRLLCAAATLWRDGRPCEDCLRLRSIAPAIRHRCYRGSLAATAVLTGMVETHSALGTWQHRVTRYIALTQFMRRKLAEGGIPDSRIAVKPNFSVAAGATATPSKGYFLFVGRLAPEKGLDLLLRAWTALPRVPLRIAGEGPELDTLRRSVEPFPQVSLLGQVPRASLPDLLAGAVCLIVPSTWYEGFPMVIVEAFAAGIPVLAANHGSLAEIVSDHLTGRLFQPGDPADLAAKAAWFLDHPVEAGAMRQAARREYDARYTPETNYARLISIYAECLAAPRITASRNDSCVPV